MRTIVQTDPNDPEATDEWPGCGAVSESGGSIVIIDAESGVMADYDQAQWHAVTILNEEQ
jgi:hypothetical protein